MHRLRIATYNIHKALGTDRRRDPERILRVIAGLGADIVALQEADYRLGDRITSLPKGRVAAVTGLTPVPVAHNDVSLGWHGNAMLVSERIRVTGGRRITLAGLEPRGAVLVDAMLGEVSLRVVGAHLGLMRRDRRLQAAQLIAELHKGGDRGHELVMGDLNEWSRTHGLEPLDAALDVAQTPASFHARRPLARLDRIAVGHAFNILDAGREDGSLARLASDHLPVWADIAVD